VYTNSVKKDDGLYFDQYVRVYVMIEEILSSHKLAHVIIVRVPLSQI